MLDNGHTVSGELGEIPLFARIATRIAARVLNACVVPDSVEHAAWRERDKPVGQRADFELAWMGHAWKALDQTLVCVLTVDEHDHAVRVRAQGHAKSRDKRKPRLPLARTTGNSVESLCLTDLDVSRAATPLPVLERQNLTMRCGCATEQRRGRP